MEEIKKLESVDFNKKLMELLNETKPIEPHFFADIVKAVNKLMINEDENIRPKDLNNLSGGLIDLSKVEHKVVIVPDLHARRGFIKNILKHIIDGKDILSHLGDNSVTIIFLGDGVHSEGERALERWRKALVEYDDNYKENHYINEELRDSFNLMASTILLKLRFSNNIHFLKGNHENIKNEYNEGNYPFFKYVREGEMISEYFEEFYGRELLDEYYLFEKNMALFCVGKNFLCSHSEPGLTFNRKTVINYRKNGNLIESLTWYRSKHENRHTKEIINNFLQAHTEDVYYFAGHKHIDKDEFYKQPYNNELVFINNIEKEIVAIIDPTKDILLNRDIINLN